MLLFLFAVVLVIAQLVLPLRWAFVPLLIASAHTSKLEVLPELTACRLVILVGLFRAAKEGCLRFQFSDPLDKAMLLLEATLITSSWGHSSEGSNPMVFRLGLCFNYIGCYLYARAYIDSRQAWKDVTKAMVYVLLPFALLMMLEASTGKNPYSLIGARFSESFVREGKIRAAGPFGTPILAGTYAALCAPLFFMYWRDKRKLALLGLAAALIIAMSSASSTPLGTMILGLGALFLWRWREYTKVFCIGVLISLVALQFVKERPVWYLISLVDFVGGSTGWHRSYLIDMAVEHLDEWWLAGSDYTAHWMPYVLATDPNHSDLTNYYIHLGVIGGLPVVICLGLILFRSFRLLTQGIVRLRSENKTEQEFALWVAGSVLFAHTVTFLTISYFDQVYVLFYALVGAIPGLISESELDTETDLEFEKAVNPSEEKLFREAVHKSPSLSNQCS